MNLEVNRLLEANEPLRGAGTALSDLIEESPCISHLKDAQTKTYIQGNSNFAQLLGLKSPDDIVGFSSKDFSRRDGILSEWWDFGPAFIRWRLQKPEEIQKIEHKIINEKRPIREQSLLFTHEGFILVEDMIKQPVLDQENKKVIGIYTQNHNVTLQRNLSELLQIYQQFYPEQNAIQIFLKYLDIDAYFNEWPNLEEVHLLFKIKQDFNLFCETGNPIYLSLREKIEESFWYEMLTRLRAISIDTYEYNA